MDKRLVDLTVGDVATAIAGAALAYVAIHFVMAACCYAMAFALWIAEKYEDWRAAR